MGRYLDIARAVAGAGYERNELNEISSGPEIIADSGQDGKSKTSERDSRLNADFIAACPACGSGQWWHLPGQPWHCRHCEPMSDADMRRAMTLTLRCHPADWGDS
ncbi:MAG: hypothetical protein H0V34_03220 [Gammaproteobacteria bacterium]|nr:hypothetical protein [Gammaproteobacteria bacterium]MBA3731710.1 hypothetical protein [Gammaproteobacteria bacterium]